MYKRQITKITEASPASDAGLQLNDIITAVDGQKVSSFETLKSALSYYAAGESVTITVQRPNGNQYTETQITVTLADRSTITDTTEADTCLLYTSVFKKTQDQFVLYI